MLDVDLFEKLTLSQVARILEVHPFELARILGHEHQLNRTLQFDEADLDRIRALAGVEVWWDGTPLPFTDDNRRRGLVRALAHKILQRGDGRPTRTDNLWRGLDAEDVAVVRRAVNQFTREGILHTQATARGSEVSVNPEHRRLLEALVEGRDIPKHLEVLWG